MNSLKEFGSHVLVDDVLKSAFSISTAMAREIPGYELHFRKSPHFWNLIDEQFTS